MKSARSISVIYPAYNEEESIEKTIALSVKALEKLFDEYEIIIVNDASTDGTREIAERLSKENPCIRAITNETNMRQGESILRGFAAAKGDLVIHNGVDYPFDLEDLALMLPEIENNDIVVASRTGRPGYTPYRLLLSYANIFLLHMLFDLKLRDYSFVQLYRREVLENIRTKGRSTGFAMPEMLLRAHDRGYRIAEVNIKYLPREAGVARAGALKVVIASLKEVFAYRLETLSRAGRTAKNG